jgi:hypothetical protein
MSFSPLSGVFGASVTGVGSDAVMDAPEKASYPLPSILQRPLLGVDTESVSLLPIRVEK